MRVLLTGASGFVGRAVLRCAGDDVEIHTASTSGVEGRGATDHRLDLLDAEATTALLRDVRPTHLVHGAWYAVPGRFWDAAEENLAWVRATLHLATTFAHAGGTRFVGVGTCVEPDPGTVSPWIYGTAKRATRDLLTAGLPALGVDVAWARIFQPYGPGEHPDRLIPAAATALGAGQRFQVGSPAEVRDFVHVDDVATALLAMLESPAGAYDVGTGRGATVLEVVQLVAELLGNPGAVDAAQPSPGVEPTWLVADTARWVPGWSPRFELETGIADALRSLGAGR